MLSERLKQLRKQRGYTQHQLAQTLGLSASAIGMYEQGRREPDSATLLKYANAFDVTVGYIIDSSDGQKKEVLAELKRTLYSQDGLMFNGEELNDEDVEQILAAIEVGTALAMARKKKNEA